MNLKYVIAPQSVKACLTRNGLLCLATPRSSTRKDRRIRNCFVWRALECNAQGQVYFTTYTID